MRTIYRIVAIILINLLFIVGCQQSEVSPTATPTTEPTPTQEPTITLETVCTFEDYFRSIEPLLVEYIDSVTRVTSGDLSIDDLPEELEIAKRLEISIEEVFCIDAYPNMKTDLLNSVHFFGLALESTLEGNLEEGNQYIETSRQYLRDFTTAFGEAKETNE